MGYAASQEYYWTPCYVAHNTTVQPHVKLTMCACLRVRVLPCLAYTQDTRVREVDAELENAMNELRELEKKLKVKKKKCSELRDKIEAGEEDLKLQEEQKEVRACGQVDGRVRVWRHDGRGSWCWEGIMCAGEGSCPEAVYWGGVLP